MNPKVLVTGGAGYIGLQTSYQLVNQGFSVVILDNLSTGNLAFLKRLDLGKCFVEGDIGDASLVGKILQQHSIDRVIHFAGKISVRESTEKPELYDLENVQKAKCLIDTCLAEGLEKFVFSSTAAVYGKPKEMPIAENTPRSPVNPYGESKCKVEVYLEECSQNSNFRSIAFRYFNASGADPSGLFGEAHEPEEHLIPRVLQSVLQAKRLGKKAAEAKVYGRDYHTHDGTCVRDYIHIRDLAEAHILGLEYLNERKGFHVMNLGNQSGFSVLEVLKTVESVTQFPLEIHFEDRRPGDPDSLIADARKAKEELQWTPKYSDLDQIIRTAWNWHQIQDQAKNG